MADRDDRTPREETERVVVEREDKGPGGLLALIIGLIIIFIIGWIIFAMLNTAEDVQEQNIQGEVDLNLPDDGNQSPDQTQE